MSEYFRIRNTVKYPTSLVVNGASNLGLEIANALLEQGGYVILVDVLSENNLQNIFSRLGQHSLLTVIDYAAVPHLEEDLRRLDYVFYLQHEFLDIHANLNSQQFLRLSNYIDSTMKLAAKFQAKYLLATSMSTHQLAYFLQQREFENADTHKVSAYNPVELQRYAENLCLEYVKDYELNGRIIRLAEIIGKGIDFLKQTMFTKIVLSTAASQEIVLPGDGLDSEYYVSVTDAAYAVVKAQFSKETTGEIYSAAYEHPITSLSIAYRLQDLEPNAGKIIFDQDQPSEANIRLYRPAKSLTQIGWKPSTNLDEALKDSLIAAKQFLLQAQDEQLVETLGDNNPVLNKIRELVNIARSNNNEEDLNSGPVSRLIAQRKSLQIQRENSLAEADNYIKIKEKSRNLSWADKVNNWLWKVRDGLAERFGFLKNLTPSEFIGLSILFVLLLLFYLGVLSPTLVFIRNHLNLNDQIIQLQTAVNNKDLALVVEKLSVIQPALQENAQIINQSKWVLDLAGLSAGYNDLSNKLIAQDSQLTSSIRLGNSLKSLDAYLKTYQSNVRSRVSNDNYLNLTATSGYQSELAPLSQEIAVVEASKERILSARALLSTGLSGLPTFVSDYYAQATRTLNSAVDIIYDYSDLASYAPEMLGVTSAQNYLIFILDSSKPMPIGGELAATVLLTMQEGAIVNAQVQSIDAIANQPVELAQYLKDEVNLTRFTQSDTVNIRDLAFIREFNDFSAAAQTEWSKRTSLPINVVVAMDLQALSSWVNNLSNVQIEQQQVSTDLLTTLELLQAANNTASRRNDLIAQITANAVESSTNQWQEKFYGLLSSWAGSFSTNNLKISASNLKLQRALNALAATNPAASNADVYTQVYLVNDRRTNSSLTLPRLDMLQVLELTTAGSFRTENYYVRFPNVVGLDYVVVCTSKSITQFEIQNISSERVRANRGRLADCYVADLLTETELVASWNSAPIDLQSISEYNFTIGIAKNTGLDITADIEINYPNRFNLNSVRPLLDQESGRVLSKLILRTDQIIELEFNIQ